MDLSGRRLADRYHLDRLIARGGMSQMWAATDELLGRPVAVKVLHTHLAADDTFVSRFRREAVSAARLANDPNIVSIYDTVSDGGVEAIVMELVHGITLRERLDQGSLSAQESVDIVAQVCSALTSAHAAGLVHRDVKPANILLGEDERVMVTDFGIAKGSDVTHLTREGTMLGTAKYVAPEQVEGGTIDVRTDIYSLGVVLYECLCGRPPFDGDSDLSTALARLNSEPLRPRQIRPQITRALEAVVQRAMARDPDDRYASAEELRLDLLGASLEKDRSVDVAPVPEPTPAPETAPTFTESERGWLGPTLLIVGIALALGAAGVLVGRSDAGQAIVDRVSEAVGRTPADDSAGGTDGGSDNGEVAPLTITGARSYDPNGDNGVTSQENPDAVPLTHDGDPTTGWRTTGYNENFPRLKPGVGLIFELDGSHTVNSIEVTTPTASWGAEIYVVEAAPEPAASTADEPLPGWPEPATSVSGQSGDHTFELDAEGAVVMVWITELAPPSDDRWWRATVNEVVINGS
ncbi:MAG: protein kinase [Actinomycetota bacterium]|nr:protein kinase [Actinomycetota bacterium]